MQAGMQKLMAGHSRQPSANQQTNQKRSGQNPQHPHSSWAMNWFSLATMIVIVLAGLAACGGTAASQQGGKVNLTYALWDPNEQVGYQKSINEFEQQHPNIHVTIEQIPWGQYWQKLDAEFAAGDAPDVFWDHIAYFPQFAQQGVLMNLNPLIQKDKLDLSVYYPQLLKQFMYNGNYYGLPKDWDTIALLYNKNIFKQMGITMPSNLTWNPSDGGTFLPFLQKLTVDKSGLHPNQAGFNPNAVKQYGFVSENNSQELYWNYIAMNGGTFLNKPFGSNFEFNQPPSVQALQFLVNLITKWHVSPSASETNTVSGADETMFARGQAAIIEKGDWNLSYLINQVNFPMGVAEIPTGPDGRISVFNGLSDAIYAKTPHPQQSWELFKWLASPQSQQIMGQGGYIWPAVQSEDQAFQQYWQSKGLDVSPYLQEAQGQTTSFPITPAYNEASTKITSEFNLRFLGQVSVQQATNVAVQQGNAAIQAANTGG